ncbi:hypothetical protein LSH36_616g04040 [Paralvinella palmiformis]|uniref:Uncharacterized protein n=1 Tax=Paralvinella palmiformis TaxID=53620 RepID=A0AAD9J569_9ANNE|nr:hypothetical protein LSH36_616g04040 [Paralvinella palmiformis]
MDPSDLILCMLCTSPTKKRTRVTLSECQHVFCNDCLLKYCHMSRRCVSVKPVDETTKLDQYTINCPICLVNCNGIHVRTDVPVNHDVFRLCDNVILKRQQRSRDEAYCQQCKSVRRKAKRPNFKCITCDRNLCGRCCTDHRRRRHQLLKWSHTQNGVDYQCKPHRRPISEHCVDCRRLICLSCREGTSSSSHSDHQVRSFADLQNPQREHFEGKLCELQDLIQENGRKKECWLGIELEKEKHFRNIEQEIRRQMERLIESIKKNGNKLLRQLDEIHQRSQMLSTNHLDYLDYKICILNGVHFLLQRFMQPGNEPIALLHETDINQYVSSQNADVTKNMEEQAFADICQVPSFDLDIRYSNMNGITLGRLKLTKLERPTINTPTVVHLDTAVLMPRGQILWEKCVFQCNRQPQGLLFVSTDQNSLLVAERKGRQISKYDDDGNQLQDVIKINDFEPRNMALNKDLELLYVTDERKRVVRTFNKSGQLVTSKVEERKFYLPSGIATNGDYIVVSDACRHNITVLKTNGELVKTITKDSSGGTFGNPEFLMLDDRDRIVISDILNNRISVFNLDGDHLFSFGMQGNGPGQLNSPAAICQDPFGNYLVVDSGNNRVCRFREDGQYDKTVLEFSLGSIKPYGIASSPNGNVAITDSTTDTIVVYSLYNLS